MGSDRRPALRAVTWAIVAVLAAAALVAPAAPVQAKSPPGAESAAAGAVNGSAAAVARDSAAAAVLDSTDYVAQLRARFTPESRRYWSTRVFLSFFDPIADGAVMLLLLFGGVSAAFRDIAHGLSRRRYVQSFIYVTLFAIAATLLTLPLAWFSGFWLEHHYQLSNQSFGAWIGEQWKDFMVSVLFFGGCGIIALAYRAIARSPQRWWAWLGVGTLPVILFVTFIQPVFVEPLYNKFEPLKNKTLEAKILTLAAKADIPSRKVLQADKSRQTKRYNAYVSGFGASQRIVLWDTILEGMRDDELLFVMGHEMGHYKLGHIWKGSVLYAILSFALFYLSWRLTRWAMRVFGRRWGFQELHDLASLPLLALALGLALQIAQPITNAFSRAIEHEADVFGLEVTQDNDAATRAFLKLSAQNRAHPEPPSFVKTMRYSHPPPIERIRFALDYRPWERGAPNQAFEPRKR